MMKSENEIKRLIHEKDRRTISGTRLGYFLKVVVTNFLAKEAQIFGYFVGYCEKRNFTS